MLTRLSIRHVERWILARKTIRLVLPTYLYHYYIHIGYCSCSCYCYCTVMYSTSYHHLSKQTNNRQTRSTIPYHTKTCYNHPKLSLQQTTYLQILIQQVSHHVLPLQRLRLPPSLTTIQLLRQRLRAPTLP